MSVKQESCEYQFSSLGFTLAVLGIKLAFTAAGVDAFTIWPSEKRELEKKFSKIGIELDLIKLFFGFVFFFMKPSVNVTETICVDNYGARIFNTLAQNLKIVAKAPYGAFG